MLLARKGFRVLLVDRTDFPSDHAMSTHIIWQRGSAKLKRWGLLDKVLAADTPPLTTAHFDLGPFALEGHFPASEGVSEAYGPRRTILDKILVDAAVEAGVELRENVTVEDVLWKDGRVNGILGRSSTGESFQENGAVVVGADGAHSLIAQRVDAPEYHTVPPQQGTYWAYWSGVHLDGLYVYPREHRQVYGFRTNDDLTLVGANWAIDAFSEIRADIETHYTQLLDQAAPELALQVRNGSRESRWLGGAVPGYFRRPFGPGWALVGDAGHQKDPCTAHGISDAFRDADLLAEALDAGLSARQPLEQALENYERQRNDASLPMYQFTCQLATLAPPTPEQQQLFAALRGNQLQIERFFGAFAGTIPLSEFFGPDNVADILA
jgi:2-polyprenyl-6-methoxyphenol hydroxylase-like FAD-dependent oxidoreductase